MKKLLWRFTMKWLVWAYTHLLDERGDYGFVVCPREDREKLMTLAAAPPDHPEPDYLFWVRPLTEYDRGYWLPEDTEPDWFKVTEVESGSYTTGPTPAAALDNYFDDLRA